MLHVDYRPTDLEQIFGNESIVTSLTNIIAREEGMPHSFLFTGRPGCGKTTFAFVLKNHLGISDEDFRIYDTANTRGIDVIRYIIEDMKNAPLNGKRKMYLLDECHQITTDGLNALLRTLEYGCPAHCFFVLCTSELDTIKEKLRAALTRRCSHHEVKPLNPRELGNLMNAILSAEGFEEYPNAIINKIVSVCDGSPGQALAILDSIIEITDEDEALKAIEQHLWGDKNIIEICKIMADPKRSQKWDAVAKILPLIQKQDVEKLRYAMLTWFEKILIDRNDTKIASVMILLTENFMYTGRPGLTLACYLACRKLENYKDLDDDIPF